MVVKRVGPLSAAKVAAVINAIFGLVIGGFVSLFGMAGALAGGGDDSGVGAGILGMLGVGAIVMLPIFYACIGFVGTLIGAMLYNVVAPIVGGVEVDLQ